MNAPIEVNADRGTLSLLDKAGETLHQAIVARSPSAPISNPDSMYYLPLALGILARPVERLGDLQNVLYQAREMQDKGVAALLAAEAIEAARPADGRFGSPITDIHVRNWGVQLAEGQMPGVAVLLGTPKAAAQTAVLIEQLRSYNILCLLGASTHAQLKNTQFEALIGKNVLPLGDGPTAAVHAFGFAARCAMKLSGQKPGAISDILDYCRRRVPGFVLALGELDEQEHAIALGGVQFSFPLIDGRDGLDHPSDLVDQCLSQRGIRPKVFNVRIPVNYGLAFEDEVITDEDLHVQFGGDGHYAFELLQSADAAQLNDGRIEVIGPALPSRPQAEPMNLAILVNVAGAKVQPDFEPFLEKQIREYINYASGVEQTGGLDGITIRISRAAVAKGFGLEALGKIIHARFHEDFRAIEKVEITFVTDPVQHAGWLEKARSVHAVRAKRLASITDDQVDMFFACMHCRAFAPHNVSIISPERVSPCGECTWLDAKASYELDAPGARKPIKLGKVIDARRGIWEGTNHYARIASHGRTSEVAMYSLMNAPMAACADFECMVVLIPEAHGVMILAHEDTTLPTPAGLTIETFGSLASGQQIPGIVAMGRSHLLTPKFLAPEGGFKRVVWMSSRLKQSMAEDLKAVCAREGAPDLMEKIADERHVTTVGQLVQWLKEHQHPALSMEKMY